MQTILDILRRAGGWHPALSLTIDNSTVTCLWSSRQLDEPRTMRSSRSVCRTLWRTERRPYARPGDVFRVELC